ncbi:dual specificity protein phosphatase 22-A, partial [Tachysurus ichikawai]
YRGWLRTSYRPSPFKEQEQVSSLLVLYAEQQAQERQRREHQDWMNQASGVYGLPYSRFNR